MDPGNPFPNTFFHFQKLQKKILQILMFKHLKRCHNKQIRALKGFPKCGDYKLSELDSMKICS